MNNLNEVNWDEAIWKEINDAVVAEVGKVRAAQKVFPTIVLDNNPTEIPDEVIDFDNLTIREGQTKQFVEIYQQFSLTATQVAKESQNKTCKTLARMAAKTIALAEDSVIFSGINARNLAPVTADFLKPDNHGLIGEASPDNADDRDPRKVSKLIVIHAAPSSRTSGYIWGENIFSAVTKGISLLTAKAQAPKFALFLPVKAYADTFVPPSPASLVTTAERIKPLVEGGYVEAVSLPDDIGLLVALAGDPTTLYVGREATTEFLNKEGSRYIFRVVERVQFVARDPRSFVLLKFIENEKEKEA